MADDPEYASSNEEEQQQVVVSEDGIRGEVVAEDDEVTTDQLMDEEQEGYQEDANTFVVCDGCQLDVAQYPFCPLTGQPHVVEESEEELPCNSCGLVLSSTPFCAATGQPHLTESRNMQQQQTSGNATAAINYSSSSSASPGAARGPREIRSERSKREDRYSSTSSSRLGGGGSGDAPLHVKELYARKREQFHQQQRTGHSASHLTSSSGRTGARATESGAEATEEILGGERGFGIFLSDNPVLHSKENQRGGAQSSGEGVQTSGGVLQQEQQVSNDGISSSPIGDTSSSAIAELLHRPNGGTSSFKGRLGNEDQRKRRGVSKEEAIKEFQSLIDRSKQEQVQDATYKVKYEKQEETRMMKQNPLRYVLSIPGRLLHSVVGTEAGFTPSMALILTIFFLWNIRRAVNLMYGGADGRDDDLPGDATMEEADRMTQLWQEP